MVNQDWPDFFVVGVARAGTTSLYNRLRQHPDLYFSILKEPHFFATDLPEQDHTIQDQDLYLALFADAAPGQKKGEASVWYLHSSRAAAEIAARRPDAKIVIMLRDPIEMIRSLHGLYLRTGNEELSSLAEAIDAEDDRRAGRRIPDTCYLPLGLQYTQVGAYHDAIARYLDTFGADNVQVNLFEDFVRDPAAVVRAILAFLGVDPNALPEAESSGAHRLQTVRQLHRLRSLDPRLLAYVRVANDHLGSKAPLDEALAQRLRARLAPDVARTRALIGERTDAWRWFAPEAEP